MTKAERIACLRCDYTSFVGSPLALFSPSKWRSASFAAKQINIAEYGSLSSTLVRIAQIIGPVNNRITRDLTPTLADYLCPSKWSGVE